MTVVSEGTRNAGARGLGSWLARNAPRSARGHVTIAILPDRKIKELNHRYRRKNTPTDVLSFPDAGLAGSKKQDPAYVRAQDPAWVRRAGPADPPHLGDIAISRGIAQKQAKMLGHSLATEFKVLALHGLLHLLGYDHESDSGRMARVEARLRRKAGLPAGLIARSS